MGKTKTVFVGEEPRVKKEKKETKKPEKVHISGLKGGERIKVIEAETPVAEKIIEEPHSTKAPRGKEKKTKVRGKKYKEAKAKIDRTKLYKLEDAIKLVKETSFSKFDGTMELHILVKKDSFATNVEMPFSVGKSKRIEVASDATIKKLEKGKIDFDVFLATPEFMPKIVPFAQILGPKGLMPNPKNGTLIKSEKEASKFSANSLTLKTEKTVPLIHTIVGKVSQKDSEIAKNIEAIFNAIGQKQISKAYLKSTMSPSVKIELS
jgi:large subunit ribosomal protein L1